MIVHNHFQIFWRTDKTATCILWGKKGSITAEIKSWNYRKADFCFNLKNFWHWELSKRRELASEVGSSLPQEQREAQSVTEGMFACRERSGCDAQDDALCQSPFISLDSINYICSYFFTYLPSTMYIFHFSFLLCALTQCQTHSRFLVSVCWMASLKEFMVLGNQNHSEEESGWSIAVSHQSHRLTFS